MHCLWEVSFRFQARLRALFQMIKSGLKPASNHNKNQRRINIIHG